MTIRSGPVDGALWRLPTGEMLWTVRARAGPPGTWACVRVLASGKTVRDGPPMTADDCAALCAGASRVRAIYTATVAALLGLSHDGASRAMASGAIRHRRVRIDGQPREVYQARPEDVARYLDDRRPRGRPRGPNYRPRKRPAYVPVAERRFHESPPGEPVKTRRVIGLDSRVSDPPGRRRGRGAKAD
jgi:hypothetical protein